MEKQRVIELIFYTWLVMGTVEFGVIYGELQQVAVELPYQRLHRRSLPRNTEVSNGVNTINASVSADANRASLYNTIQTAINNYLEAKMDEQSSSCLIRNRPALGNNEQTLGMFARTNNLVHEANLTDNKTFKCVFFGNPIPNVTWITHIYETKVSNILDRNNSTITSTLEASNIKWEDRGRIECHASNDIGNASAAGSLTVHSPPVIKEFSSRLLHFYKGINFTFPPCEAQGYPLPTTTWERGYGLLPGNRTLMHENGILEIRNVNVYDEGTYLCKANNYLGESRKMVRLNLRRLRFANRPSFYVTVLNLPVNLNCSVYAYHGSSDLIQGLWYNFHDRNETVEYTTSNMDNKIIFKAKITKEGTYVCQIKHLNEQIETNSVIEKLFFPESRLMNNEEKIAIGKMIYGKYKLCWSSSIHGSSPSAFHQRCDGKSPTVSLFRIPKGIVGGYTDKAWGGSSRYLSSSNAFMFHIQGGSITKYTTRRPQSSTYTRSSYGPTFGGGHDLYTSSSSVRIRRYTRDYSLPSFMTGSFSIQAEVFYKV